MCSPTVLYDFVPYLLQWVSVLLKVVIKNSPTHNRIKKKVTAWKILL